MGRIAGPFANPPFATLQCSPIGVIPKRQQGEWRLMTYLSFPEGDSINDGIPAKLCSVKYVLFNKAVEIVCRGGRARG